MDSANAEGVSLLIALSDTHTVSPVPECPTESIPVGTDPRTAAHTTAYDSSNRRSIARVAESVAMRNQLITERRNAPRNDDTSPQLSVVDAILADPVIEKILDTPIPLPSPVVEPPLDTPIPLPTPVLEPPLEIRPALIPVKIQDLSFGDRKASGCQLSTVTGVNTRDNVYSFIGCMDISISSNSSSPDVWCKQPFNRISLILHIVCRDSSGLPTIHTNSVTYYSSDRTWDCCSHGITYYPETRRAVTKSYVDLIRNYTKDAVLCITAEHCVNVRIINDAQTPASIFLAPFTFENRTITSVEFDTSRFHDIVPRAVAAVINPRNNKW